MTLLELLLVYDRLNDKEKVEFILRKGENIISKFPYSKFRDRFENYEINLDEETTLVELMKIGYWIEDGENISVGEPSEQFLLIENATINNQVKHMHKVYYATYLKERETFANFVEPYFEDISDLWKLK